jgi:hypothetical protein
MITIKIEEETLVNFQKCTQAALDSILVLDDKIRVKGCLSFWGCTGITTIPRGIIVSEELNLWYCKNLVTLPSGIGVGLDLHLGACELLLSLPEDLRVGGRIRYNYRTGLSGHEHERGVIPNNLRKKMIKSVYW